MKIAATLPLVVLLSFVMSVSFQSALAKPKAQKQLIKQEPIFDTTAFPTRSPFKLEIKHTRILFPEDPSRLLHGKNQVINLRADKSAGMLHGRVTQDNRDSIINTLEYGVKGRFYADLRKLRAKSAPELSWLIESELAKAGRRVAGAVAREEPLMNRQLNSRPSQPELPSIPLRAKASPEVSRALEAELAKSTLRAQRDSQNAIQQFRAALSKAQEHAVSLPVHPIPPAPKIDTSALERQMRKELASANMKVPEVSLNTPVHQAGQRIPSAPELDTSTPERELTEQLARNKGRIISASRMNTELLNAKKQAQFVVSQAEPAMNAILTTLRPVRNLHVPAASKAEPAADSNAESVIQWDAWHTRFASLAREPILKYVRESGNPSGANTVEVTVWPDRRVAVRLSQKSNAAFDQAILKAYQSLNGNPALEYPPGSRRSSITFLIDNKHTGTGVPSGVKSQTSVGDKEILRHPH